jgi:tRNA U34 5-methylaminomethyl-2-thiouridine-forming methyltransferase MnmC
VERRIIITADGSSSVSIPAMNITYHSIHGAIQESKHIFIEAGFESARPPIRARRMSIFEMGFGTGLNALLSLAESEKQPGTIYYETIELFPLDDDQLMSLNYCDKLQRYDLRIKFEQLHNCEWEKEIPIMPNFIFKKKRADLLNFETSETFDLIYFDAFDPRAQPELWTEKVFKKMFSILNPDGILVTYSSKGDVRRAMQAAGFSIEKIAGPPGKREMVRAYRSAIMRNQKK